MSRRATQLIEQPHGGALANGGTLGNKSGPGKIPRLVVERCQTSFYKRINLLEKIADSKVSEDRDRLKALEMMGKYGRLEVLVIDDGRERAPSMQGDALLSQLLPMVERLVSLGLAAGSMGRLKALKAMEVEATSD